MATYAVFESCNMQSTGHNSKRIFSAVADVDIENGTFGYLDELADNYSNIYNFKKGAVDGKEIVVVDQPAWDCDTTKISNQRRDKFIIPAGTPFRVRVIAINDEFGISIQGVTEGTRDVVTVVDDFKATKVYVTIDTTGKLVASTTKADNALFEGKIERKRVVGAKLNTPIREYGYSYTLYEVRVLTAKGGNC